MTIEKLEKAFVDGAHGALLLFCAWLALSAIPAAAQDVKFNVDDSLQKPEGYREWVYVGTPLTPNELNDGEAPFPEFHSVYINPKAGKPTRGQGISRRDRADQGARQRGIEESIQRRRLLHGRVHWPRSGY